MICQSLTQNKRISVTVLLPPSDILESIKDLASGKTPGSDGLPADFHKFFYSDIKDLLFQRIIMFGVKIGELSTEQKRGIITV